jgi:hypothetical protein
MVVCKMMWVKTCVLFTYYTRKTLGVFTISIESVVSITRALQKERIIGIAVNETTNETGGRLFLNECYPTLH